jgi:hypothetical protein
MRVLSIWVFVPVTEVFTFLKNDKYYDIIALIVICLYIQLCLDQFSYVMLR